MTDSPFSDLQNLLNQLPDADETAAETIKQAFAVRPIGSYGGEVEKLVAWLGRWQGQAQPKLDESHICVLASSYKNGMTPKALKSYIDLASNGQAYVNQLCKINGVGLRILELAVDMPFDASNGGTPSWSESDVMAAVAFGMEASAAGGDMLALSDLAFGSEPYAIAIMCRLLSIETGQFAKEAGLQKAAGKAQQILNRCNEEAPLDLLRSIGGREMAAAVGGILAARSRRLPVLLDGWAASVAALILWHLQPSAIEHCYLATPLNDAHKLVMSKIGLKPIVDVAHHCAMGAGAAMAINVLKGLLTVYDLPLLSE